METYLALAFMIFGLGFFIFVIRMVQKDDQQSYDRMLREAREFGYQESRLQREATTKRRSLF